MSHAPRFSSNWEPELLEEEVVAEGSWRYQDAVEYNARLVRRKWDYTSADIDKIESQVEGIAADCLDYNIGEEGNVFFWVFEAESGKTLSRSFPSFELAKSHIYTYAGTAKVVWSKQ